MPTYEYACRNCGHEFELFQSITAPVKRTCPKCRQRKLQRRIGTGAGVIFKGSGFYQTDYRSDSYRKAAEAESKAGAETAGSGKTEAKSKESPAAGDGAPKKSEKKPKRPAKTKE